MSYDQILVSDLETMAAARNYRNWIYRRIAPHIGQRVLEIGAGIGNFTALLLDRELVVATDNYPPCLEYLNTHLGDRLKAPAVLLDASEDLASRLNGYEFDTVICLNVLEHITDDSKALRQMHALLRPGGRLVLLVPAFQCLHGSVDRALGHHRRYTRRNLLPAMQRAGFVVERSFYMNLIGMAGWFWNNRIIKRSQESGKQIGIFDRYIAPPAEFIERWLPPPLGLSLIAIGRKE
ncbi:MAG TPA: methyltransferase domain-containing protein [Candidatus Dormibacteraeota bacterium]|nr:methyltransferase domain-containing protein [Candidatus Dormibacteraeota bacterium]